MPSPLRNCRMTFGEHVEFGERLRRMRDELQHLAVRLGNTYRLADNKHLSRAVEEIDKARCWLDGRLFEEHQGTANTNVYYGDHAHEPTDAP